MEVEEDGPSFPSNYVTIHDLKQRWLQQQQKQKQQIPRKKSNQDSELNPKPTTDDSVPRNRSINQRKSPPPPVHKNYASKTPLHNVVYLQLKHDSASKTLATNHPKVASRNSRPPKPRRIIGHQNPSEPESESVEEKKQHHRCRNQKVIWKPQPEPEPEPVDKKKHQQTRNQKPKQKITPFPPHSDDVVFETVTVASPAPAPVKQQHRSRNQKPKHKTKLPPFDPPNDDSGYGDGVGVVAEDVAIAAPVKDQAGRWSRNKKVFQPMIRPFDAAGDDDDDDEVNAVAVAAPVKLEHQAGRRTRNKKVFRPKTPPFDAAGDDDGLVKVEALASVKEINVCNVNHTKEGYGRFQGGSEQRTWSRSNRYPKPPSWGKKGQMSQVWVKKGESAPN